MILDTNYLKWAMISIFSLP
ncbi:hypothetical protein MTR67_024726 [Solanum verrucosum]|uniref:Uncharacterized protein n=1 Tax=Solanum verrucosum TaxID=315347 RepID=A0AAF0TSY7_SOLVR|nr:hypothetical protein MTR67_024726 [Solanum verrucosum]